MKTKRSVGLSIRITPEEHEALKTSAEHDRRTVSDQARNLILLALDAQMTTGAGSPRSATRESASVDLPRLAARIVGIQGVGMRAG